MLTPKVRQMNLLVSDEARDGLKLAAAENNMKLSEFAEHLGRLMATQPWLGKMVKQASMAPGLKISEYSLAELSLRFRTYLSEYARLEHEYSPELALEKLSDIVEPQDRLIYAFDPATGKLKQEKVHW